MPSKSKKQERFMAAAHDSEFADKAGIKQSVAKEFNKADSKKETVSESQALRSILNDIDAIFEGLNCDDSDRGYFVPQVCDKNPPELALPTEKDRKVEKSRPDVIEFEKSPHTKKIANKAVKQGPWHPQDDINGVTQPTMSRKGK